MPTEPQKEQEPSTKVPPPSGYMTEEDPKPDDKEPTEPATDDFGYETDPKDPPKKEDEKEPEKKEGDKEPEKEEEPGSTGYDKEPEKPKEEPEKEAAKKEDEGDDFGLLDTTGLLAEDVQEIREFAKKYSASKEIVKGLVEQKKAEVERIKKWQETQDKEAVKKSQEIRQQWFDELKNDPDFGGENFSTNVKKADKILAEHMPNTKKKLTESGAMLPPYVMRDLAKLADVVNSTEKLVQGDPIKPEKDDKKDENDPLSFYE